MFNTRTKILVLAVVVGAATLLAAGNVEAFWHRWCGGCGYGAGYGGYSAGYGGYSVGYGGYSVGYGGYSVGYGSYGSYYAPACSSCETYAPACSSCAGGTCATSNYGVYYPTYYQSYPTYYQSYYPVNYYTSPVYNAGCSTCSTSTTSAAYYWTAASAPKAAPVAAPVADDPSTRIVFTVRVPADAKVFVNDRPTTSTGSERTFTARNLKPGSPYGFTVRSERVVGGRTVSETQILRLVPGQTGQLAFTLQPADAVVKQGDRPMVRLVSLH